MKRWTYADSKATCPHSGIQGGFISATPCTDLHAWQGVEHGGIRRVFARDDYYCLWRLPRGNEPVAIRLPHGSRQVAGRASEDFQEYIHRGGGDRVRYGGALSGEWSIAVRAPGNAGPGLFGSIRNWTGPSDRTRGRRRDPILST